MSPRVNASFRPFRGRFFKFAIFSWLLIPPTAKLEVHLSFYCTHSTMAAELLRIHVLVTLTELSLLFPDFAAHR